LRSRPASITGLLYVLWPLIAAWPVWEKTLAVVPLMVPAMVWGVIPAIQRWLHPWIYPSRHA
jgi:antibiotic biosynthesis monooxygenase (ABM) superfamily enzyme